MVQWDALLPCKNFVRGVFGGGRVLAVPGVLDFFELTLIPLVL